MVTVTKSKAKPRVKISSHPRLALTPIASEREAKSYDTQHRIITGNQHSTDDYT